MLVALCGNRFDLEVQRNEREDEAAQILKCGRHDGERTAKRVRVPRGSVLVQVDQQDKQAEHSQHGEVCVCVCGRGGGRTCTT